MVYCFTCGGLLVPGLDCVTCRDGRPTRPSARERELPDGRPILTLVKTFPLLAAVDPPPHAA